VNKTNNVNRFSECLNIEECETISLGETRKWKSLTGLKRAFHECVTVEGQECRLISVRWSTCLTPNHVFETAGLARPLMCECTNGLGTIRLELPQNEYPALSTRQQLTLSGFVIPHLHSPKDACWEGWGAFRHVAYSGWFPNFQG